ncbi:ArsR/SmtB family transcription factor [Thermopirellula anaerolimosa]
MLPTDECNLLVTLFRVLGHPTRLQFFCLLREGEKTVTELAQATGVPQQNASQHLRLMRECRAVRTRRQGQQVLYRLADKRLVEATEILRDAVLGAVKDDLPAALRTELTASAGNLDESVNSFSHDDAQSAPTPSGTPSLK